MATSVETTGKLAILFLMAACLSPALAADPDLDGLSDATELMLGTDPLNVDNDRDGTDDGT